jgi:RNA polymerase sigma-70 factor (ECF subfamily)
VEAGHRRGRQSRDFKTVHVQASGLVLIYGEIRGELLRFLTARVGDAVEAEDILQELWIRVQAPSAGPVSNGRAYLYRAAQNLVLDRARARHRQTRRDGEWAAGHADLAGSEPADLRPNAEAALLAREEAAALVQAIEALPTAARRAFRMHKIEGLPHAEVAARLGISRSGVEKHIALAMAHLRRALKD